MLNCRHLYAGVPSTRRGEPTHISVDPTGKTDNVVFASGRVAVIRSICDPLSAKVFALHAGTVTAARFSQDASLVASADDTGCIRLWLPDTVAQKSEFDIFPGPVRDLAFSKDGKFIVACGECRGAFVKVVKVPTGASAGLGKGHSKRVVACDVSNKTVASASEDMSIGVFPGPQIREFDVPHFLRHHTAFVNDVRFSPNGAWLAISSSDRTTTIVDVGKMTPVYTLSGHTASVTGVSWISDDRLVTSSNDKTVREWTIPDGKCTSTLEYGSDVMDMQVGCSYAPKTGEVVSVSLRPQVNIRHPSKPDVSRVLRGHSKQIVGLAVMGRRFYSADYSGLMVAWELDSGASEVPFSGKGPANSVCALAANHDVVANVGQDGKVFVTPVDSLIFKKPVTVKGGGVDIAVAQSASPEFSAIMINEVRLVAISSSADAISAELLFERQEVGTSVAVSSDGSLIAIGIEASGDAGELRFYTLSGSTFTQAGETIQTSSAPNKLSFSPDGDFIAVGEKNRRVKFYNCETKSIVTGGGIGHTARVDAISFSADGTFVASGGMDGSIAVWPVDSDKEPIKLKTAHRNGVTGIAFATPECIVSSGGDACIRSWNL